MNKDLAKHPFMHGMSEEHLTLIEGCVETCSCDQGKFLLRHHQQAGAFFLLIEGRVVLLNHLAKNAVNALETLAAPNVVGWSWLVPPYRWHFDVQAIEPTRYLRVHTQCLLGKMETDKVLASEMYKRFLEVVVDRLQAVRLQSLDIYAKPDITPYFAQQWGVL